MTRPRTDLRFRRAPERRPPDDFVEDILCEMSNLDAQDTDVPGTISISTALGAHGPRVNRYPGRAGRTLPCLIVSVEVDPKVRDDFIQTPVSRAAAPQVIAWVHLNHAVLLNFWINGASWSRREVSTFLDGLRKLS